MVMQELITRVDKDSKKTRKGFVSKPRKNCTVHIRVSKEIKTYLETITKVTGLKQGEYISELIRNDKICIFPKADVIVRTLANLSQGLQELQEIFPRTNYLSENRRLDEAALMINQVSTDVKNKIYEQVKDKDVLGVSYKAVKSDGNSESNPE